MCFLRIAEELLVNLNSPVESGSFVVSHHIPHCVNCKEKLVFFLRHKAVFLRLELFHGATIAAETGQAVINLTLDVK